MDLRPAPARRPLTGAFASPLARPPAFQESQEFVCHGERVDLSTPDGWLGRGVSRLTGYHLHYFDDLPGAGAEPYEALLERWINENPPAGEPGWEPYPLSRRLANTISWILGGNEPSGRLLDSLAAQARYLVRTVEWDLRANHLLANAKALAFAGAFFSGPEAERWLHSSAEILAGELDEQILADGGHFERSPMYHALVCEDLLDLLNLGATYDGGLALNLSGAGRAVPSMLEWIDALSHPDDRVAYFNDTTAGGARTADELRAYAARLGVAVGSEPDRGVSGGERAASARLLAPSGFARLQAGPAVLLVDAGSLAPDYQPGHAHAGTASFELSLDDRRLLVNSGISTYEPGARRDYERGTSAHNTVEVDGADSSEMWGAFRVARRARVIERAVTESGDEISLTLAHDGYRRLSGGVVHHRTYSLDAAGLTLIDQLAGSGEHRAKTYFHLHPDVAVRVERARAVLERDGSAIASVTFDPATDAGAEDGMYSIGFGSTVANQRLVTTWRGALPARFTHRIEWL